MTTPEQVATLIELMQQQNQHLTTLMQQQQNQRISRGDKTKKPDRPVINAGIDDREWAVFIDTWSRYKNMIGVNADEGDNAGIIRMELRTACSTEVNRMLFEFVGSETLNMSSEEEMLEHIKSVAVKQTHPEVHQTSFNLMKQEQGETITHYVSRLKAKAFLCKFEVTCHEHDPPVTISYAENMVAQRLVAGLANVDHQRKVLSEAATLRTLTEKIKRLQVLETTEESAFVLHGAAAPTLTPASEASACRSRYKREITQTKTKNSNSNKAANRKDANAATTEPPLAQGGVSQGPWEIGGTRVRDFRSPQALPGLLRPFRH